MSTGTGFPGSRRRRRGGGSWTPQQLFGPTDVGLWYDYAAITPEMLAWRRNLLLRSEEFDNASWTTAAVGSVAVANQVAAPDGALTADLLREDTSTGNHYNSQSPTVTNAAHTFSVYYKIASGTRKLALYHAGTNVGRQFDATGGISAGPFNAPSGGFGVEAIGDGWYRAWITTTPAAGSASWRLWLVTSANVLNYTGDGASGFYVWGAQVEQSSSPSAYQRITNFTSDFVAAFPTTAIYQDSTGVTPVTALGQPVGFVLDKARSDGRGVVNLLTRTEEFENAAWAKTGTTVTANSTTAPDGTTTADTLTEDTSTGQHRVLQVSTVAASVTHTMSFYVKANGRTRVSIFDNASASDTEMIFDISTGTVVRTGAAVLASSITALPDGWYRITASSRPAVASMQTVIRLVQSGTTSSYTGNGTSGIFLWGAQLEIGATTSAYQRNGASVGGPGNHAIQSTPTARPVWDARKNFFANNTDVFPSGGGVAGGAVNNGNGSVTFSAAGQSAFTVTNVSIVTGAQITLSVDLSGTGVVNLGVLSGGGVPIGSPLSVTLTSTPTRYTLTRTNNLTGSNCGLDISANATTPAATVFIARRQLELGSTATSYQRVTTATDYADVGFSRGALFDGSDDFLVTAANLVMSSTDEVTVIVGIDKRSDATVGMVAELSASVTLNNGTFYLAAPGSTAAPNYAFANKGTSSQGIGTPGTWPAPDTAVVTGLGDIGAPSIAVRRNGVQSLNTGTQGTGNYGTYPLFIGRRGGTTLPFNGRITQLIIIGRILSAAELAQVERYVATQSGVLIP